MELRRYNPQSIDQGSNYFFVHGGSSPEKRAPVSLLTGALLVLTGALFYTNIHWIGTYDTPQLFAISSLSFQSAFSLLQIYKLHSCYWPVYIIYAYNTDLYDVFNVTYLLLPLQTKKKTWSLKGIKRQIMIVIQIDANICLNKHCYSPESSL